MVEEKTYRQNKHQENTNNLFDLGYFGPGTIATLPDDATKKEILDKFNEMIFKTNLLIKHNGRFQNYEANMLDILYNNDEAVAIADAKRKKITIIENSN